MKISERAKTAAEQWLKKNIGKHNAILEGTAEKSKNGTCLADRWKSNSWIWLEKTEQVREKIAEIGLTPDKWDNKSRIVLSILSQAAAAINIRRGGKVYEVWAVEMSEGQIMERSDYTEKTVRRAINALVSLELIDRIKRGKPGESSIYAISQKQKSDAA